MRAALPQRPPQAQPHRPGREPAAPCRAGGGAVPADAGGAPREIQSAQPVRIGISVSLVPDYLPGLETQLDKFRQQYPHIEMRFRLLDNDAVADGVEQGELDAGLVMDLGCAAPVLARTTLRATRPACWCRGATPSGRRRVCRWPSCGTSGSFCPACGRTCLPRCGRPAPGRALRPTRDRPQLLSGVLPRAGAALHLPDPVRAARGGSWTGCGMSCWKTCRPSASRFCSGATIRRLISTCCAAI